jgi:sterol 3beta-glucosyltransferase
MLEARAELSMRPSFDMPRAREIGAEVGENGEPVSSSLAQRLMEIFQFEKAEEVIEGRIASQSP